MAHSISVIGLGIMGQALARTLIDAGYDVTVWNRTPDKAAPLVDLGARQADSPAAALSASDTTLICIRSHEDTRDLLAPLGDHLAAKTIIELSTGGVDDAEALMGWVKDQGADCLIGMISTFPKGIGQSDSAILLVGDQAIWKDQEAALRTLGGKSDWIGDNPKALAAIYASLFLPRQGFMFGMIYGAMICEKAGVSMESYVEQLPLTIKVVHDYYDVFAASVPSQDFDDPPASLGTYHAAFQDTLSTCAGLGAPDELPQLLNQLVEKGIDAGLSDKQITALTRLLSS